MRLRLHAKLTLPLVLATSALSCKDDQPQQQPPAPTQSAPPAASPTVAPPYAPQGTQSIPDVVERILPSVVNIASERVVQLGRPEQMPFFQDPMFRRFFGPSPQQQPTERRQRGMGSGVIVSAEGIILTNNHVVEKADEIVVTLMDGRQVQASIVGTDPPSDVAVIRLKDKVDGLQPLGFGDSNRIRLGEVVLAVGNPFDIGRTVTMGIVSAKGRANVGIVDYEDFIQTDAAINPGNSGGPLVNMAGQVVGINTAIVSRSGGYQGIGFAIPSNLAKQVMSALIKDGRVVRGWLGVGIQELNSDLARALGLPVGQGVLVSDIMPGGPADRAGLQRGDVVTRVNGQEVHSTGELRNLVAQAGANTTVKLDVLRQGKPMTIEAKTGELPSEQSAADQQPSAQAELGGLTLVPLTADTARRFGFEGKLPQGVVVADVAPGSPAARSGLRPGDVIVEADRQPLQSVSDFVAQYKKAQGALALLVHREGRTFFVAMRKE